MSEEYFEEKKVEIPEETLTKWQNIVNTMAEIINVPAALIMKLDFPQIEVLRASDNEKNPYEIGSKEHLLGLYCEEVIKTRKELLISDARESEKWKNNPDIKRGMVSYFGFPLTWPDGNLFGTICVLDSEKNEYSDLFRKLMIQFKELVESHLALIFKRREIEREKEKTDTYLDAAGTVVVILDKEGIVKRINDRGSEILGYEKREIEGEDWFEKFIPAHIREDVKDFFGRLISGEAAKMENEEIPIVVKGGSVKTISWHNNILKNEEGKITGFIGSGIDVTEKKQAEEQLKRDESLLCQTEKLTGVGGWEYDVKENSMFWTEELFHIHGFKPEERGSIEKSLECYPPEAREKVREAFSKALEEGKPYDLEVPFINASGEKLWVRTVGRPIIENSEVVKVIGNLMDITSHKKMEKRHRLFGFSLDRSDIEVYWITPEGRFVYINETAREKLGYSRDELKNMYLPDIVPDHDRNSKDEKWERLKKGESLTFESKHKTKEGEIYPVEATSQYLEYRGTEYELLFARDITERKQAEEELRETKERYRKIVENADEWIWILDREGNFKYANRAALENSGYEYEKWLNRNFEPIVVEKELPKVKKIFTETLEGKSQSYEFRIKDVRGNIRTLQVNTAPLIEEGEAVGTVSVGRDVTDEKEKEKEFRRMDKLESLGVLAGGIAHDFNNLLMGIMGNISLARMNVDDEETREILSDAEKASKKASRLTEQLLTFSKGGEPLKEKTAMEDIIRESAEFVLHGSNVKCEYGFSEDLWKVEADKGQMSQVINNIVLNADQSMPEGGKILITGNNVILGAYNTLPLTGGKYIEISIEDEGMGIPEEHLDKIFDPYFSTKRKGHGLGMTTVYSIIQKHGGHIKAESKLGEGTTFYIYLPALEEEIKKRDEKEEVLLIERKKILLMDDEEIVRKAIGRMLKGKGSDVVFAKDGKEAVRKFKEAKKSPNPFDVIILDLTIPGGMGGKETAKEIRKIDSNVKIIVASGYSNDPVMANYEKYGFNGVIAKPFYVEELIRTLNNIMNKE